jgi:hypothetical protein
MTKPIISSKFTMKDIRNIREYNYFKRKVLSSKEYVDDINSKAEKGIKRVEEIKKQLV